MKCLVLHEYLCAQKDNEMTIWDSLAFLVAKLIVRENVISVELEAISNLFNDKYGYKIPIHPLKTLFYKMVDTGILMHNNPQGFALSPKYPEINTYIEKNNTQPVDLSTIVNNLWKFIKEKTKKEITIDETEEEFLKYLKTNQYEIIQAIVKKEDFDKELQTNDEMQYYINDFVYEKLSTSYENKELLVNLLIANINLSSIFF